MVEMILVFLFFHFLICFGFIVGDLWYGWRHGSELDFQFVLSTVIGGLIWPCGIIILIGINLYNYFRKK